MFEANYLTMLLKPNYEKPVNTAEDIFDRGLGIIRRSYSASFVEDLKKSPFPMTRALAERTVVAKVIFFSIGKFPF